MTLFQIARSAHIVAGVLVLASFWLTVLARKGNARHRRLGRVYLIAMSILLAISLVMAVGMVSGGEGTRALFNVYITLISVVSVWMAWRSIEDREDVVRYNGWASKLLCALLGGYAIFLLLVVMPRIPVPAVQAMVVAFALLGLTECGVLLWRQRRGADHPQWWLSDHLTAMALNFGATHASFSILALGSVIPAVKAPWARTSILVFWMVAALVLRLWAGRRFLGGARVGSRGKRRWKRPAEVGVQ